MEIASAVKHLKAFVSKAVTMDKIMISIFRKITIFTQITIRMYQCRYMTDGLCSKIKITKTYPMD